MLKEQLKQQIVTDAEELTKGFKDTNNYEAGIIQGYKEGYEDAGDKYAALWQAAEEKAARYEKALEKIRDLTPYSSLTGDQRSETMVEIATEALTPKAGEDDQ